MLNNKLPHSDIAGNFFALRGRSISSPSARRYARQAGAIADLMI